MIVKPGSQRSLGLSKARFFCGGVRRPWIAVGHRLYCSIDDFSWRRGEEQEQPRARLLRVQGQLMKCLEDIKDISALTGAEPCSHRDEETGGTDAGGLSAMDASRGELSYIEYLLGRCPSPRSPVRFEGVSFFFSSAWS